MKLDEVMKTLEKKGSAATRKTYQRHGAPENMYGVKVADMKEVLKKTKQDTDLALALWDTGNADARYLAGLMADASKIGKKDLEKWAKTADWQMLREYSVAGVAADSPHGLALARAWIDAKAEAVRTIGWATWGGLVSVTPDEELDLKEIEKLLARVEKEIHQQPERVRYVMNAFVIAVGGYVAPLTKRALAAAKKIGKVEVDMGDTSCKVPPAGPYIEKIAGMGRVGKKRKTARC